MRACFKVVFILLQIVKPTPDTDTECNLEWWLVADHRKEGCYPEVNSVYIVEDSRLEILVRENVGKTKEILEKIMNYEECQNLPYTDCKNH